MAFLLGRQFQTSSGADMEELSRRMLEGFYVDMLRHLEADLNFTARVLRRKDGKWGSVRNDSGGAETFTGMLSSLLEGEADLIAAPFTNWPHRSGTRPISPA